MTDGERVAQLEAAILLAMNRLRPYAEIHTYVGTIIDTLRAAVEEDR